MASDRKKPLTDDEIAQCARLRRLWDRHAAALGLTQEKVAEEWGVSQGAVSAYLTGRNRLNIEASMRFAAALHVDVAAISEEAAELARAALRYPQLDSVFGALPETAQQMQLDFLGLQLRQNQSLYTSERYGRYVDLIEKYKTAREHGTDDSTERSNHEPPEGQDHPASQ